MENDLQPNEKDTIAKELCRYALFTQGQKESPHEAVKRFFLIIRRATLEGEQEVTSCETTRKLSAVNFQYSLNLTKRTG